MRVIPLDAALADPAYGSEDTYTGRGVDQLAGSLGPHLGDPEQRQRTRRLSGRSRPLTDVRRVGTVDAQTATRPDPFEGRPARKSWSSGIPSLAAARNPTPG